MTTAGAVATFLGGPWDLHRVAMTGLSPTFEMVIANVPSYVKADAEATPFDVKIGVYKLFRLPNPNLRDGFEKTHVAVFLYAGPREFMRGVDR